MVEPPMDDSVSEQAPMPVPEPSSPIDDRELQPEGGPPAPSEPSRLGRFARRALRRVTAVVVIFGLGFGATWLLRVRPLLSDVDDLTQQAEQVVAARDQLQDRVNELEGVEQRNQELEQSLIEAGGHLDLLAVLVDVTSAQLAIAQENTAAAKVALAETDGKLEALAEVMGNDQVEGIRERLQLVLEEVDADIFAAQRDLEVLSNTLVAMERDRFGGGN